MSQENKNPYDSFFDEEPVKRPDSVVEKQKIEELKAGLKERVENITHTKSVSGAVITQAESLGGSKDVIDLATAEVNEEIKEVVKEIENISTVVEKTEMEKNKEFDENIRVKSEKLKENIQIMLDMVRNTGLDEKGSAELNVKYHEVWDTIKNKSRELGIFDIVGTELNGQVIKPLNERINNLGKMVQGLSMIPNEIASGKYTLNDKFDLFSAPSSIFSRNKYGFDADKLEYYLDN